MSSGPSRRLTRALALATLAFVTGSALTAVAAPGPDDTTVDHPADAMSLGAVPDAASGCTNTNPSSRTVAIPVSGVTQRITGVAVGVTMTHTWLGDLTLTLVAPSGEEFVVLSRTGRTTATSCAESANLGGSYVFADDAEGDWWGTAVPLPSDGVVPAGSYRPSAPGGLGATGASTLMSPAFAGATASGTWTLRVTDDGAGDTGGVTDAFLRLTVDTTGPDTEVVGPADGATLASAPTYEFGSAAEDLAGFQCQVDGGTAAPCTSPFTVPDLPPGAHTFAVAAVDTSGNLDPSPAGRGFVITAPSDTTPPDTTVTGGPASGARVASAPIYTFGSPDDDVDGFVCQVDAGPTGPCTSPFSPAVLPGAHTFRVAAVDSSGNVDATPATRTFTLRDVPCESATAKVKAATKALAKAKAALKKAKKTGNAAKVAKAQKQVKKKAAALKTAKAKQRSAC